VFVIRIAGGLAAMLLVVTLMLGAWHSQANSSAQGPAAVRDRVAMVVDVGAVAATAVMTTRRGR
jgi:hypothetical protein